MQNACHREARQTESTPNKRTRKAERELRPRLAEVPDKRPLRLGGDAYSGTTYDHTATINSTSENFGATESFVIGQREVIGLIVSGKCLDIRYAN